MLFSHHLGPMRLLTKRGIHLKRVLTRRGYAVIEVYPGAAQDIWHTGRKQDGLSELRRGLQKLGVKGLNKKLGGDELDAVTAALVSQLFLRGKAEVLGNFKGGAIVIPTQKDGVTLLDFKIQKEVDLMKAREFDKSSMQARSPSQSKCDFPCGCPKGQNMHQASLGFQRSKEILNISFLTVIGE
jgi:hypothetical protein